MTHPPRLYRAVTTGGLATLSLICAGVLTGCGPAKPERTKPGDFTKLSGAEISRTALQAMKDATAVRIRGNLILDGERVDLDARRDRKGTCGGTMANVYGTAEFVTSGPDTFLKADESFWKTQAGPTQAAAMLRFLNGRWARLAPTEEFAELCTLSNTIHQLIGGNDATQSPRVGDVSRFDGHEVVALIDDSGADRYRLLVTVKPPHFIREAVNNTPGDTGKVTFSDFSSSALVRVPGSSEYVDLR